MKEGHVFIIAEAGVNHNGSVELAKQLVKKAKEAGVDAVKFQTFQSINLVSKFAEKAEYQKASTAKEENQLDMIKKLELSYYEFIELKKYCDEQGILFLSTPFDLESIDFLNQLEMPLFKIPSGEITNLPYLIKIARTKKHIILSTGMSNLNEVSQAIDVLNQHGAKSITLLHCNTEYPTPMHDVNLRAMETMRHKFHLNVGYSDHTMGIEVPIAAVAMGAKVIEKHFTLDKKMDGPDHKASLEPDELKNMVQAIRNIEKVFGTGEKKPSESEIKNINIARKSIVAAKPICKGECFTEANLTVKRPGNGISPMKWFEVIGREATQNYEEDELIHL